VDHAPALFPHFAHLVEDGQLLVVGYQQSDERHHHEGASPAHPRAAVHDGTSVFLDVFQELVEQMADPLPVFLLRHFSIEPVQQLEVSNESGLVGEFVRDLQGANFECFLGVDIDFFDKLDLELLLG
jgi:hypothetical protein